MEAGGTDSSSECYLDVLEVAVGENAKNSRTLWSYITEMYFKGAAVLGDESVLGVITEVVWN